jgi:predicted Zn-dependent protease
MRKLNFVLTAFFIFIACDKIPITGRQQLHLLPESEMDQMALQEYTSFLDTSKVITGTSDAALVQKVGQKIATAVTQYCNEHGFQSRVANYKWEFHLVQSKEANAWCMPGGKVVVYSGILSITQDENGLAVVLGHEISHAIAQHGNERMSDMMIVQAGGMALDVALQKQPAQTQSIFNEAYGVGTQVGAILPFSRNQESEADEMGLCWIAMAGYNPNVAIPFWQRMMQMGGAQPPEFLSDHPSDVNRVANLKVWMPKAMAFYHGS